MAIEQIGKFKVLPKGTNVWSIKLQKDISFSNDEIIEPTNGIYSDDNVYFCKVKNVSMFSGLSDSFNGELGMIDISKLQDYYPSELDYFQHMELDYKNIVEKESIKRENFDTDEEYNEALISEKENEEAALDYFKNFKNYKEYSKFEEEYFKGL